jgi:hypothetical protein
MPTEKKPRRQRSEKDKWRPARREGSRRERRRAGGQTFFAWYLPTTEGPKEGGAA